MSEELKAALARIACLEGEIAKRDARIVELELEVALRDQALDRHVEYGKELRAELAAIKAQEPVAYISGCYRDVVDGKSDRTPLGAELAFVNMGWIGQIPLYAAPVSEAKAQGVALDGSQLAGLLEQVRLDDGEAKPHGNGATYWNNAVIACQVAIRDALAAPVQQVSVPECYARLLKHAFGMTFGEDWNRGTAAETHRNKLIEAVFDCRHLLAAAPAAPAADAGLIEALELAANRLDRLALEQGEFWRGYATAWADEARATANGVKS